MKVGDVVRFIWSKDAIFPEDSGKVGLIVDQERMFFKVLWEDGTINGNIERQLEVISESR